MKSIKLLVVLTTLMWVAVRFFLRPLIVKYNLFDFWFTESYPSFGLVFGFTLMKYSFFNNRDKLLILCCGATLGGLLYEILGQGYFDFGTFSYSDVVYTLIGGVASYLTLKHFERQLNNA
ncbi:MAG: hypothetical protein K2Q21_12090 [Chitinophagaceae bacterium]|nr:hypothetical protein [Chitinophagaceae bacterium]